MLRINLLPAYIAERRKTRLTIAAFSAAFLAVTAGMLAYWFVKSDQVRDLEAQADAAEAEARIVQGLQDQARQTREGIGPILAKVTFVDQVRFFNTLRPRIYRQAAAYTHRDVQYNSMSINGNTLAISAFAENLSDVGRFLITMFGNPDLTAVSVSGPPGWPAGQAGGAGAVPGGGFEGGLEAPGAGGFPGAGGYPGGGFPGAGAAPGDGTAGGQQPRRRGYPFTVNAILIQPVTPPTPPRSGGAGGAGGFPGGSPGGMGGYPGAGGGYPGAPPPGLEAP